MAWALVPKRWAKRAVTRNNAIKRQIYNVSAQPQPLLPATARMWCACARGSTASSSSARRLTCSKQAVRAGAAAVCTGGRMLAKCRAMR